MAWEPHRAGFLGARRVCPRFGRLARDIKIWEGDWDVWQGIRGGTVRGEAYKDVGGSRPRPHRMLTAVLMAEDPDTRATALELLQLSLQISHL